MEGMVTSDKYKKERTPQQMALVSAIDTPAPITVETEQLYELSILKKLITRYPQQAKQYIKELSS
jgi:hypothetical protein